MVGWVDWKGLGWIRVMDRFGGYCVPCAVCCKLLIGLGWVGLGVGWDGMTGEGILNATCYKRGWNEYNRIGVLGLIEVVVHMSWAITGVGVDGIG